MAFLAFLVLAFTDPRIENEDAKTLDGNVKYVSVYIDNSLSMQSQGESTSLFKLALRDAFEIVDSYSSEVKFQLITNDLSSEQRKFVDKETFVSRLDAINYSPNFQTINRVIQFHIDSKAVEEIGSSVIYLLSDFRNNIDSTTWKQDSLLEINVLPYTSVADVNVGIDSVWINEPIVTAGKEVILNYRITNYGVSFQNNVEVNLEINGSILSSSILELEANSTLDTGFAFIPSESSIIQGNISLKIDPIDFDNNYYFTFEVDKSYQVLEISGSNIKSPFEKVFDAETFAYHKVGENSIRQDSLNQLNLLIFNQLENLNSGLMSSISALTKNGVNVLISIPKDISKSSRELIQSEFNVSLESWDTSSVEANFLETNDAIFKDVFETQPKNLNYPNVHGHWKLKGNDIQPLIQLFNNDPLVCAIPIHNARVFFISTELSESYTNFQKHALFVPTVLNICMESGLSHRLSYLVGDSKIEIPNKLAESYEISSIEDSTTFIPGIIYDGLTLHDLIKAPGFYELKTMNIPLKMLAFNYNRKESIIQNKAKKTIDSYFTNSGYNFRLIDETGEALGAAINIRNDGYKLWPFLLLFGLFFLLIESVLLKLFR